MADLGSSMGQGAPAGGAETGGAPAAGGSSAPAGAPSAPKSASGDSAAKSSSGDSKQAESKAEAIAEAKLKARWRGKDHEATPAELRKMLSDDYEHEFSLGEGQQPKKLKWDAIQRAVQLSEGAMDKMREAAAARKQLNDALEWGKKNVPQFLATHLGIQNFDDFIMEHGQKLWERTQEYQRLSQTDPVAYHAKVAADAEARADAKRAWERQQAEQAQRTQQQRDAQARAEQAVGGALQALGVRPSRENLALAEKIFTEHAEVGFKLSLEDLAALTRDAYRKQLLEQLDAHEGDALLELLGDDRRAKLREMEVARAKGQKAEARAAAAEERKEERAAAPAAARRPTGVSEREFNRRFRVSGGA